MTIIPPKDPRPDTTSDRTNEPPISTNEPPISSKAQPGLAVPPTSSEPDLESRINTYRAELIAKLGALKGDLRQEAAESRSNVKSKLSELAHLLKWGIVDGWASIGDDVKHRLEHWLGDSSRPRPAPDGPPKTGPS